MSRSLVCVILSIFVFSSARGQDRDHAIRLVRLDGPINLDGMSNVSAWERTGIW